MDAQKIRCNAKSKQSGEQCKRWAAPGKAVCHIHGGAERSGRPSIHGFYSKVARGELAKRLQDAETLENPMDMSQELLLDKAILSGILADYDMNGDKDLAKTELILKFSEAISRKQQRMMQLHNQAAFSPSELQILLKGMGSLLSEFIPDPYRRKQFIERLRQTIPGRKAKALSMPSDE